MENLPHPDRFYLQSARGWLDLGNLEEAERELDKIAANLLLHPEVLRVKARLFANKRKWDLVLRTAMLLCEIAPEEASGWLFRARALQQMDRSQEAYDLLFRAREKFPTTALLFLELARAAARLRKIAEALTWLKIGLNCSDSESVKEDAKKDPELRRLLENGPIER